MREAQSAGLVVIGDEILKGKCVDSNTAFATQKLWEKVSQGQPCHLAWNTAVKSRACRTLDAACLLTWTLILWSRRDGRAERCCSTEGLFVAPGGTFKTLRVCYRRRCTR